LRFFLLNIVRKGQNVLVRVNFVGFLVGKYVVLSQRTDDGRELAGDFVEALMVWEDPQRE
jgi:hypothetical protein